ncbi:MAG: hypothetical protein KC583_21580, partial [Myxococcales bacterium]|nr:hypothetical protein [Myxococcales bacterium]
LAIGGCVRDLGHEMVIEAIPRDAVCEPLGTMEPSPPGDAGVSDAGPPPPDGGPARPDVGPPPVLVPCVVDADCVDAPGPRPQHCDGQGFCRPDRPGGG